MVLMVLMVLMVGGTCTNKLFSLPNPVLLLPEACSSNDSNRSDKRLELRRVNLTGDKTSLSIFDFLEFLEFLEFLGCIEFSRVGGGGGDGGGGVVLLASPRPISSTLSAGAPSSVGDTGLNVFLPLLLWLMTRPPPLEGEAGRLTGLVLW